MQLLLQQQFEHELPSSRPKLRVTTCATIFTLSSSNFKIVFNLSIQHT